MIRPADVRALLLLILVLVCPAGSALAQIPGLPSLAGGGSAAASGESAADEDPAPDRQSLDDLIKILETEATRNRLIESLKAAAYQPGSPQAAAADATLDNDGTLVDSLPQHLAATTRTAVEALQMTWNEGVRLVGQAGRFLSGAQSINLPRITSAILPVSIVAVAVVAALALLTLLRCRVTRWLSARATTRAPHLRLGLLALAALSDALTILVSAGAGHAASLAVFGGPPNLNQALFLNAFVLTELIKVVMAAFVMPHDPALRMTPFSDGQARYWYRWLAFLVTLLGYTFLFVAPVVQANSNMAAGNAVRFIIVFVAFLIMLGLILQNRVRVGRRLERSYRNGGRTIQARFYFLLGHVWWLLAGGFVFALFALWLSSPRNGFQFMLTASLKSIAAMTVGGLVVSILTRIIVRGVKVPAATKERFPLLERRINSFIPKLLLVVRIAVVVVVIGVILDAWSLLEFDGMLQTDFGQRSVRGLTGALVVLLIAFAIFLVVSSWVEYRLNPNFGTVPTARERTLLSLFRNAFTIALAVIVLMLVLSQLGIDIAPLLAGAGVVGLAVGFGAQKLVQDIITGAFIQIENALNEGDVVQLGSVSGVVEKLTIRSVSLRSLDGTYHLIPFSSVDQVANKTKDFSNFVADVEVAYRENIPEVKQAMQAAYDMLRAGEQGVNIIADFEILGVETLGANSVTIRGRIRTLPGKQWGVGRLYNEIIKGLLDDRGIEIPFPQTTVWFGEGKNQKAPPLRIANLGSPGTAEPAGGDPGAETAKRPRRAQPLHTPERNPDGTLIPPQAKEDDDGGEDDLR